MPNLQRIRSNKLPRGIEFTEEGNTCFIHMSYACTTANMQENKAAFEAWALYAKTAGYERVVLSAVECASEMNKLERQHYNRFLYRALRFDEGFDWFSLSPALKEKSESFVNTELSRNDLYINAPVKTAAPNARKSEATIERLLVRDEYRELLNAKFCIDIPQYYHQLPVGLFGGSVISETAIFPRSHAAIDIWGLNRSTFHLIELKVKKNQNLGVLSEVFFYACFVRDMFCQRHLERKTPTDLSNYGEKLRGFNQLVGANIDSVAIHILTEQKHPQLDATFAELQRCKLSGIRFESIVCYPLKVFYPL